MWFRMYMVGLQNGMLNVELTVSGGSAQEQRQCRGRAVHGRWQQFRLQSRRIRASPLQACRQCSLFALPLHGSLGKPLFLALAAVHMLVTTCAQVCGRRADQQRVQDSRRCGAGDIQNRCHHRAHRHSGPARWHVWLAGKCTMSLAAHCAAHSLAACQQHVTGGAVQMADGKSD